jgi:transposase
MNSKGKIISSYEIKNSRESLQELAESLSADDQVALEATGHWMYLYEQLESSGAELILSHPQATKAIASARLKNDKVDSRMLAHLLRTNLLPRSYIPPREVRDLRELLRLRGSLLRMRSTVKTRLRSILLKTGHDYSGYDILGKSGREYCGSLEVRECYRIGLDRWCSEGEHLDRQLKELDRHLGSLAKSNPEAELLMTIPGIGLYSALLILAEIGEISRFKYSDQLVSWAGLAPRVDRSSTKVYRGPITKKGSKYLRWILIEDTYHAIKLSRRFQQKYESVKSRRGPQKARVAVAALMLRCIHWMLTHKEPFKDVGE